MTRGSTRWSRTERILFRFAFLYFGIHTAHYIVDRFAPAAILGPFQRLWWRLTTIPWQYAASWIGTDACTGFDRRFFCPAIDSVLLLIVSVVLTLLWTALDRERTDYRTLHAGLRVLLRYWLAFILWLYGWDKLIQNQFGRGPADELLLTPIGEMGPTSLMWSTMGYSYLYQFFTGLGETLGAALVLFRRTTTLGAMVIIMVMASVTVLDVAHDVSVTNDAVHYMLMAMVLLAPDARRLARLYLLNEPVPAWSEPPLIRARWHRAVKLLLIAAVGLRPMHFYPPRVGHYGRAPVRHPWTGVFQVERFDRNGGSLPPLLTDSTRWIRVALGARSMGIGSSWFDETRDPPAKLHLLRMHGAWRSYDMAMDTVNRRFTLFKEAPPPSRASARKASTERPVVGALSYEWLDARRVRLSGTVEGDSIFAELRKMQDEESVLRKKL